MDVGIFQDEVWQMAWGERAALEGLLSQMRPRLAVEIGSAEGACLARLAEWAHEVHSFDLAAPTLPVADNVTLHTGDSHELLPAALAEFADQERNVELIVVDGDHSPEGVRRDLEDILNSSAVRHSVVLIHDTANPRVRQGLDATRFAAWPKVAHVDLDWIPGRLFAQRELRNELWYGLGLVLVDVTNLAYLSGSPYEARYHPSASLLSDARDVVLTREVVPGAPDDEEPARLRRRLLQQMRELSVTRMREVELRVEVDALRQRLEDTEAQRRHLDGILSDVMSSASWKVTKPLRLAKHGGGHRRTGG